MVIESNNYGITDAVIDGETGLLVQTNDNIQRTNSNERLIHDRLLAHKLGDNGYHCVKTELKGDTLSEKLFSEFKSRLKKS